MKGVYLVVFLAVAAYAGHHDNDCHKNECDDIQQAIENIGMYFDKHLCESFKHVHCNRHHLNHDEQICGTDGHTYDTHCDYAKARCEVVLDKHNYDHHTGLLINPLRITNYGACVKSTVPTIPPSATVPTTPPSATAPATTMAVTTPQPSTTVAATTTPTLTTTSPTQSVHDLLGSVFCQYKDSINCASVLEVTCGTDGNYYVNSCELLKVMCVDLTLRMAADNTPCTAG